MKFFFQGYPNSAGPAAFAPEASDSVQARVLAAGVAETVTIPTDAVYVMYSATADFYAKIGAAAAIPSADVTDGSATPLNPGARRIPTGATTIGIIAPTSCIVTLEFWK